MATTLPTPGIQERLDFLATSSHLLMASSPQTAAYLMHQRNNLLRQHNIPVPDVERHHVCQACGSIATPGAGAFVTLETGVKKHSARAKRHVQRQSVKLKNTSNRSKQSVASVAKLSSKKLDRIGAAKVTACPNCASLTKSRLPLPPIHLHFKVSKKSRAKSTKKEAAITKTQLGSTNSQPSSARGSTPVKKRRKGKNGGLQALLAGQKKPTSGGLSLADFMKK